MALLAVAISLALLVTSVPAPSLGSRPNLPASLRAPVSTPPIDPAIAARWEAADGPVARHEIVRGWVWGPSAIAVAADDAPGTLDGVRRQVYFDKGRLDIADPSADATQPWFAVGAQLVTEMLAGAIQTSAGDWIERGPAEIPVVGDPDQPDPVTYATLGAVSRLPTADAPLRAADATGTTVTALLAPDGTVVADAVPSPSIAVARYDATTGHNIAQPFADWEASQPYSALYVLGHPLSEPYWVKARVAGVDQLVMLQAFERRVLSYTPENPDGWQVESGNAGQHYRAWRELSALADPRLAALAVSVPYGDEIVKAAGEYGVDPWLMAAISDVASGGDPLATSPAGHAGLLGVRWADAPRDPLANARIAAAELARITAATGDHTTILGRYYAGDDGDLAAQDVVDFVAAVTAAYHARDARFSAPGAVEPGQAPAEASDVPLSVLPARFGSDWWAESLAWYAGWSGARPDAVADPNGRWCVATGAVPGDRLRLVANSRTADCTVGAMPGDRGLPAIPDGQIAISASTAAALGIVEGASAVVVQLDATALQHADAGRLIGSGPAAYYASGYDRAWWERTIALHASWGGAVAGWTVDANGYYCVHPDFKPGARLRLVANSVTVECTIGDTVQAAHQAQWRAKWAIELSWDTFKALGLDRGNNVQVFAIE